MAVKKLSVALEESVAEGAAEMARERGISLSAWLNEAAEKALKIEQGLAAVAEWEAENGPISEDAQRWADDVMKRLR